MNPETAPALSFPRRLAGHLHTILVHKKYVLIGCFRMGLYRDLDEIIDEIGIRLIALIPEDVRVIALSQRGALTNNWSKTAIIFDTMVKRLEGVDVPIIIK